MATLLYRLGRFAFRRAWLVIGAWVVILAVILGGGLLLGGKLGNSFAIPGTESQEALDRLEAVFPSVAGAAAQVVVVAPDGASVDDYKSAIEKQTDEIAADYPVSAMASHAGEASSIVSSGKAANAGGNTP